MNTRITSLFVCIIALTTGCSVDNKPASFDYGKVENNEYVNSYFNVRMNIPEGWNVQAQEQIDHITKVGKDIVAGDDENMKAILKASDVNSANLLGVFQHEYGAAVSFNPNFMVIAENFQQAPGIRTGKEYLFHSRKLLAQSQFQYDHIDEDFGREVIDGVEFYTMNAAISMMGIDIRQIYYCTIIKGFSFNVIISYSTDQEKQVLLDVINSMKL